MNESYRAYIVRARVFYSYFPTTLTLIRALYRLHKEFNIEIDRNNTLIAGPYAYKDGKIYAYGGARLGALRVFDKKVGYVPFDTDRIPFYTIDGDKVEIAYPIIPSLVSRVNPSRDSFTSTGEGRVAYNRVYYVAEDYRLLIVADGIPRELVELLGNLGFGRYKTIGGGFFEIEEEVEVEFVPVEKEKYTLTTLDTDYKGNIIGELQYYPVYIKEGKDRGLRRIPYYPGGIIEGKDPGRPEDERLLPKECRPERKHGFPKIKRSARAPFIIFLQTRGGSSSR